MGFSLSNLVHEIGSIGHRIYTTIKVDLSYLEDPAHQAAIEAGIYDVATYGIKAIKIVENVGDMLLPTEAPVIDEVATALIALGIKAENFAKNPSLGTFIQIGGESLRAAIAKELPMLKNGVKIGGQLVTSAEQLAAVNPAVLQAIFGSHVGAYVNSAGNVSIEVQNVLNQLTAAVEQPAPAPPALTQPPAGT